MEMKNRVDPSSYTTMVYCTPSNKSAPEVISIGVDNSILSMIQSGLPTGRATRESVLQLLSDALLRRSLTKIDLSQRGLRPSDARLVKMALLQNSHLTVLKLGYNNLGDAGTAILAKGIAQHEKLESLDLGFNMVGDEGCRCLAKALMHTTVHTLYLAGNLIGQEGAVAIADWVLRGSALRRLNLTGNRLGPDGVAAIAEAIIHDSRRRLFDAYRTIDEPGEPTPGSNDVVVDTSSGDGVEELYLGGTGMGPAGCRAVARLLEHTSHLRVLSLNDCELGDESVMELASCIKSNRQKLRLESLQLSFNRLTCRAMEALANALWGSQTLKELRLDNNEIADLGIQHIASVLPLLKVLETLDVGFNRVKSHAMKLLMKSVVESNSLVSLSLSGNTVDTDAAKAIAYALAYSRSLLSLSLMHSSVGHEGQRQIVAGIVSNVQVALRELTGFMIGPVVVTLGFPPALEHWTNEQVLNFVRLMWDKSGNDASMEGEEKKMDRISFVGGRDSAKVAPMEAGIVVDVARKAYAALVEDGLDVFSRRPGHPNAPCLSSPIAENVIVVEYAHDPAIREESISESSPEPMPTQKKQSFVVPPEVPGLQSTGPARKKRIVEWLCLNIQHLNKFAQQPFSSSALWRLHQHYFTPVINESGGTPPVSMNPFAIAISSVPEVPRVSSSESPVEAMSDSTDENSFAHASDPIMKVSALGMSSLPMLKRKVSYRFLGDASLDSAPHLDSSTSSAAVSKMIEAGVTCHTLPRKTKRARCNRSRISFLPRVKAKLDSYLDVCHEKALITMRQLYYVEQSVLAGKVNPIDPSKHPRSYLCGDLAADAETIIVDMT